MAARRPGPREREELSRNLAEARAVTARLIPYRWIVVDGPPGHADFEDTLEDPVELRRHGFRLEPAR